MQDYNFQRHMAHEERQDGCHSPAQVLGWVMGMQPEPELIYRAFSAIGETRVLNLEGDARARGLLQCAIRITKRVREPDFRVIRTNN